MMALLGGRMRLQLCWVLQLAAKQGSTSGVKLPVAVTFEVCVPATRAGLLVCVSAGAMLGSGHLRKGQKLRD